VIQYEDQGSGTLQPTSLSLEPVTTIGSVCQHQGHRVQVQSDIRILRPPVWRPHCLAERRTYTTIMKCQSIAHMSLHQEETITPRGLHCPEACSV